MKALLYEGIKDVKVKEVGDPKIINEDDIIVRVTSTAICGSDLHLIHGMVPNLPKGSILGHETMGIVEETYANVGPVIVPEELPDEQVLFLTDVLPTSYWGVEIGGVKAGDTVVVLGCGPIGLTAIKWAALKGAKRIIAVDYIDYRYRSSDRCLWCKVQQLPSR